VNYTTEINFKTGPTEGGGGFENEVLIRKDMWAYDKWCSGGNYCSFYYLLYHNVTLLPTVTVR
jgi:hypothetical protein